jgi:putative flavoprotein involved in K+ transport
MTTRTDTVIIGGGQAGLSLSRHLATRGQPHVVLERGRVGERWRSERWDSLRLLTPNWLNRLDGTPAHDDPDAFLSRAELVGYLDRYARLAHLPVREHVEVLSVEKGRRGFRVRTDAGAWRARNVVVASGDCGLPHRPAAAADVPAGVRQLHASGYRNPAQLAPGGVLVVGAGPSGQQIAAELRRAGRGVVLAVGTHASAPRRYRGRDIMRWVDAIGDLDLSVDDASPEALSRRSPSLAITGANGGEQLDLAVLARLGVTLTGRLERVEGGVARFAGDLADSVGGSRRRLRMLLGRIDDHIAGLPEAAHVPPAERLEHPPVEGAPRSLDLVGGDVSTVIWATGYRRSYPWLHVPVLDEHGEIVQRHGVTPVPGLFTLGVRFQSRRSSHFIGRVGRDASVLAWRIAEAGAAERVSRAPWRQRAAALPV